MVAVTITITTTPVAAVTITITIITTPVAAVTHDHHHHDTCGCGHNHTHDGHSHMQEDHGQTEREESVVMPENVKKQVYILENLGCANCAAKMERQIRNLSGVKAATITYATKQLVVAADDPERLYPQIKKGETDSESFGGEGSNHYLCDKTAGCCSG